MRYSQSSKFQYSLIFVLISVVIVLGISLSKSYGEEDQEFTLAPLSDSFLKYIEDLKSGKAVRVFTADGYPLGAIPDPVDCRSLINSPAPDLIGQLPLQYDLRTKNKLTPIKNQGSCGSCWAFASMGALESSLMPKERRDFSEQHLINTHGFDYSTCEGGSRFMAVAYLARWAGPLNEADKPYIYSLASTASKIRKHVQNVICIPARSNSRDNQKIKQAVIKYGAVVAFMYIDSNYYDPVNYSYYNPSSKEASHLVCIVGWKDNYSKLNFKSAPPGDGAFIVRNSWGANWGEGGYFYISYYDPYFATDGYNVAYKKAESIANYKEKYDYDPNGWTHSYGATNETAWMANIFKARTNTPLKAVSFYALGNPTNYTLYIYTNVSGSNPINGTLVKKKSGRLTEPGYFTIPFSRVPLLAGEKFSVVVKINTVGNLYPIPIEMPLEGYTKKVRGSRGQSFISSDGNAWTDLNKNLEKANICLKAFTKQ